MNNSQKFINTLASIIPLKSRKIDKTIGLDNHSSKFYPLTRPSSIDSGINDTQSSNTLLSSSPESPGSPQKPEKRVKNTQKLEKSRKFILKPQNLKNNQNHTHNLYRTSIISLCDNNCETTLSSTVLSSSTYLCENCSLTICKNCKKRQKFGKTCHGIPLKNIKTPIFGEKLDKLEKIDQAGVPSFIYNTIKSIEQTNIHRSEGFYRKTGSYKLKAEIKKSITTENCSKSKYPISNSDMLKDPHIYAQIFKDFFRELPAPIIPQKINNELCRIGEITDSVEKCSEMRAILKINLSRLEIKVFSDLIMHLARVSLAVQDNLMTAGNLAIIWVQCLMGFDEPTAENIERLKIENEKLVCLLRFVIEVAADDLRNKAIKNLKSGKILKSSDEISKLDNSFDNREHWMRKQVTPRRAKSLRVGSTHL